MTNLRHGPAECELVCERARAHVVCVSVGFPLPLGLVFIDCPRPHLFAIVFVYAIFNCLCAPSLLAARTAARVI